MVDVSSPEKHPKWGRSIAQYPKNYTKESLAVHHEAPVDDLKREIQRRIAFGAIHKICALGDPSLNEYSQDSLISCITLEKLECILETARFAGELWSFALPRLVAGCIILMSSVKPSPFEYEYGYMCFKIMLVALYTCLLKHTGRSEVPYTIVNEKSPNDCLSALWSTYPALFILDLTNNKKEELGSRGLSPLQPWTSTLLEKPRFDALLALLDNDQKHFTIALRDTCSLGLFGLIHVLWQYIESEKTSMGQEDYEEKLVIPYARVCFRYRLATPNFGVEPNYLALIHDQIAEVMNRISKFIDIVDSRNLVKAYINYVSTHHDNFIDLRECIQFGSFVAQLIAPGCEDLICDMFDTSMNRLWNSLPKTELETELILPLVTFFNVLAHLEDILARLEPLCAKDCSWIHQVMERLVENDVAGLILRLILMFPPLTNYQKPEDELMISSLQKILKCFITLLLTYTSDQYLKNLLRDSGTLRDWQRYLFHFVSFNFLEPGNSSSRRHHFCTVTVLSFLKMFVGDKWEDELSVVRAGHRGLCSNPRCPFPFGAEFAGSQRTDAPYCSTRCQAFGSVYASHESHNSNCQCNAVAQGKSLRSLINPLEFMPNIDVYAAICGKTESGSGFDLKN